MAVRPLPPLPLVTCQGCHVQPQLVRVRSWSSFACCLPPLSHRSLDVFPFSPGYLIRVYLGSRCSEVLHEFDPRVSSLQQREMCGASHFPVIKTVVFPDSNCVMSMPLVAWHLTPSRCIPKAIVLNNAHINVLSSPIEVLEELSRPPDITILMQQCNACVVALLRSWKFAARFRMDTSSWDANESIDPARLAATFAFRRSAGVVHPDFRPSFCLGLF